MDLRTYIWPKLGLHPERELIPNWAILANKMMNATSCIYLQRLKKRVISCDSCYVSIQPIAECGSQAPLPLLEGTGDRLRIVAHKAHHTHK